MKHNTFLLIIISLLIGCSEDSPKLTNNLTEDKNTPPEKPSTLFPTGGQKDIDTTVVLKWESFDDDNQTVYYQVYFDTVTPPKNKIGELTSVDTLLVDNLIKGQTYYWRVIAFDGVDSSRSSVFSFSTKEEITIKNNPPSLPSLTNPTNGEQGVDSTVILKWNSFDEDEDSIFYNVFLDTVSPPKSIVISNATQDSTVIHGLKLGKTYYWQVYANDKKDTTRSSVFSFSVFNIGWDDIIPELKKKCYIIGFNIDDKITGLGTGFAISNNLILTNAHVVTGIMEAFQYYDMTGITVVAVQDGGKINGNGSFEIESFSIHPDYDSTTNYTYDFGFLKIKSGVLPDTVEFESDEILLNLKSGQEVATIGFPGETNDLNTIQPIATYKQCNISALRPFDPDNIQASPENNVIIQHDCNTTGGTSGSPIINIEGKVIAIHNSGEYEFLQTFEGWERIPVGALDYSIRIDQIKNLSLNQFTKFSEIEPLIVTYTFINTTWSDVEIYFDGDLYDTIPWKDTLELWDHKGTPVLNEIRLETIHATNNYLFWTDTIYTGKDFFRRYVVTDDYFFLGIENNSNKIMKSVVVENFQGYDSSSVYLSIGDYKDIGYYKVSILTDVRLYFYNSINLIYWEDLDTRSTDGYAEYIPLEASLTLPKKSAILNKHKNSIGTKRLVRYRDFINKKK